MPKDRDQLTPEDPKDAAHLASNRGQGTGGSGSDQLAREKQEAAGREQEQA